MAKEVDAKFGVSYRAPEIVTVGDAVELTGALDTPNRDNPGSLIPAYHNANPPKTAYIVDLDD